MFTFFWNWSDALDIDRVIEDWISKVLLTIIMLFVSAALWRAFNFESYDKCLMRLENSGIVYLDPEAICDEETPGTSEKYTGDTEPIAVPLT